MVILLTLRLCTNKSGDRGNGRNRQGLRSQGIPRFSSFLESQLIARVLQLAEAGLNIVLISRTQHKLTNVADEMSIQIFFVL